MEREQVTKQAQRAPKRVVLAILDAPRERFEDHRVNVRASGVGGVVLDRAEHLEWIEVFIEPAPEALRDGGGDVALAPLEQVQLVLSLEQVVIIVAWRDRVADDLDDLAREQPLDDRLDRLRSDERHHLARVEVLEVV